MSVDKVAMNQDKLYQRKSTRNHTQRSKSSHSSTDANNTSRFSSHQTAVAMNDDKSCPKQTSRKQHARRSKSNHRSFDRDNTLDFPFLQDEETKKHIQQSKIMLILRGLPGSGKSFLANKIKEKYGKNSVICSADKFFEFHGEYNFDPSRLEEAHRVCQQKAKQACHNGKNLIVVDNSNVCAWEMEYYLQLATDNGYIQLIVEPKSPWKFTVDILAAKNNHGLKQDVIRRKLSKWEHLHPVYFAWFINERDSSSLKTSAISCVNECLTVNEFSRQLSTYMRNPHKDFCHYFNLNHQQPYGLHCTAIYFGHKNKNKAMRYMEKLVVSSEYGKVSKLCVFGFIITPQSFGACVNLTLHQSQIWRNDKSAASRHSATIAENQLKKHGKNHSNWENDLVQSLSSAVIHSDITQSVQCTAHITLGNGQGSNAKQTGIDLTTALNLELQSQMNGMYVPTFKVHGGLIKQYGNYWIISLERPYIINAIFASFF